MAVRWFELVADYKCNNRCVGCFSVNEDGPSMGSREAVEALAAGRRAGAKWLWLGGGDPTTRRDLPLLVRAARKLGYERVKLQTNGMLLDDPETLRLLVQAGVTEVNFSIKGLAVSHDLLTQTPGCHARMTAAMALVRRHGLPMEGDVLVYKDNAHELPEIVRAYAALGVARFQIWLFSTYDEGSRDLSDKVARIAEVMPHLVEAMKEGVPITSLHTPPCTVPEAQHAALFHAPDLGLLVANPGGHQFMLEESPIEGGTYLPGCAACKWRPRCGGLRAEYLRIHGESEFKPVAA